MTTKKVCSKCAEFFGDDNMLECDMCQSNLVDFDLWKHIGQYFTDYWYDLQRECHEAAKERGFWDTERNQGELIALMHSELSEALEGIRSGNPKSEKIGDKGYTQLEEELADLVIRLMDMAGGLKLSIPEAIVEKLKYNSTRPYKHGRKF